MQSDRRRCEHSSSTQLIYIGFLTHLLQAFLLQEPSIMDGREGRSRDSNSVQNIKRDPFIGEARGGDKDQHEYAHAVEQRLRVGWRKNSCVLAKLMSVFTNWRCVFAKSRCIFAKLRRGFTKLRSKLRRAFTKSRSGFIKWRRGVTKARGGFTKWRRGFTKSKFGFTKLRCRFTKSRCLFTKCS